MTVRQASKGAEVNDDTKTPVAVLGLGAMGGAIARHLTGEGFAVTGYDPDPAATRRAVDGGVTAAADPVEAVARARFVVTSLPDPAAVRSAWEGDRGLVASAARDAVLLELSTIDPGTMTSIAELARADGLRVIDCAVSGGPDEAAAGKLGLLVGAEEADLDRARPLLDAIGASVSHTGDVGTGKTVKIVNNMMSMGNVLVAAEAFEVGVAAGVDPQRLFDVLAGSGGSSHHFVKRFPWVVADDRRTRFSIRLADKDLGLAEELARSLGIPSPTASMVRTIYALAIAEGMAGEDIVGLTRLYRRWGRQSGE
jgi:3-hydroxyisobutyrate dehydrogenase-like beta-hydroxyacid dehydrogenase